jgi:hypothetical protein
MRNNTITIDTTKISNGMLKNLLDSMTASLSKDIRQLDKDIPSFDPNEESGKQMKAWSDGAKELRYTIANQVNELCRNGK